MATTTMFSETSNSQESSVITKTFGSLSRPAGDVRMELLHPMYTPCYCEENIYWLANRFFTESKGDVFVVFISNQSKTVALWNQRVGSSRDTAVIWDYHVVLALRSLSQTHYLTQSGDIWIYDLDSCLPIPCHWDAYVSQTFPLGADTLPQYQSQFRVIPGDVYLDNFASDRSHMLETNAEANGPRYLSVPPPYPAICGPTAEKYGIRNNLMTHFVSMSGDEQGFGTVMDLDGFGTWCSTKY